MAKKNNIFDLQINEEKVKLLKFYLALKGEEMNIDEILSKCINDAIDKLYNKHVPKDVRFLIEHKKELDNPSTKENQTLKSDSENNNDVEV